jgi:hypothetical protein
MIGGSMADQAGGSGDNFNVTIGPVGQGGQVAVGKNITQVTSQEREELARVVDQLRRQVEAEAPPERKAVALEQVAAIQQEVQSDKPDLGRLQAAKQWFVANLPKLAGAVGSVVVHPIVGKLVEATGEAMAKRWKEHVGGAGTT